MFGRQAELAHGPKVNEASGESVTGSASKLFDRAAQSLLTESTQECVFY